MHTSMFEAIVDRMMKVLDYEREEAEKVVEEVKQLMATKLFNVEEAFLQLGFEPDAVIDAIPSMYRTTREDIFHEGMWDMPS